MASQAEAADGRPPGSLADLKSVVDGFSQTTDLDALEQVQRAIEDLYRKAEGGDKVESLRLLQRVIALKQNQMKMNTAPQRKADSHIEETLARAQRQVELGTTETVSSVIGTISEVLLDEATEGEYFERAVEILRTAHKKHPALEQDILALVERLPDTVQFLNTPAQPQQVTPSTESLATSPTPAPSSQPAEHNEMEQLQAEAIDKYYRGEFTAAASLYRRILQIDPNNAHGHQYLERCEYNIQNNIIPDRRIPPQARDRYNRATSLANGRNFSQAKTACLEALNIFRSSTDLSVWPDAESLMQRIEEHLDADKEAQLGKAAMEDTRWDAARQHYKNALNLDPTNPEASFMVNLVQKIGQVYTKAQKVLTRQGNPVNLAPDLLQAREVLTQIVAEVPDNQALLSQLYEIDNRIATARSDTQKQADALMEQAALGQGGLEGQIDRIDRAIYIYSQALRIGFDEYLRDRHDAASRQWDELNLLLSNLKEVDELIRQDRPGAWQQAFATLESLKNRHPADVQITKDPYYLALVSSLQERMVNMGETALDEKDLSRAHGWFNQASMSFFNEMVGDQTHLTEAKGRLTSARRSIWIQNIAKIGGGLAVVLIVGFGLSQISFEGLLSSTPPPAPTATVIPATPTPVPVQASVDVDALNVRRGPGINYGVLTVSRQDDVVTVIGREEDSTWVQICCFDGESGWVNVKYMVLSDDLSNVPVVGDRQTPTPIS